MNRDYEIVYIFDSRLDESQINEKLDRFHGLLTGGNGKAEITAVDHWGRRELAYQIEKRTNGYYVVVQFTGDGEPLPELERLLKLDDDVLRYLIVVNEGVPTAAMSIATREPRSEDDEDEDEDEDED